MRLIVAAAIALAPIHAIAQEAKPLTVQQCLAIATGLNSLSYVGQQLGDDPKTKPADAKQYKLGAARMTIALDIAALGPVIDAAQKAQQGFIAELPPLPAPDPGKVSSFARDDAIQEENKRAAVNQNKILAQPCNVSLARLKVSDLNIGDNADQNQIPPPVLAAIAPIIDGMK